MRFLLLFLLLNSYQCLATSFGRLYDATESIWMGKTITIAGEDFYFNDKEEYELFQRKYASKLKSKSCLNSKTTRDTCECQKILFDARLRAIDRGYLMTSVRTKRSSHKYIKRFEGLRSKLEKFSKRANQLSKTKIKGKRCKRYGSYTPKQCSTRKRNYRKTSCACYQKWLNTNIDYLSTKIKLELKKIRSLKLGRSNPLSLIKTSIGLLDKCQAKIATPKLIAEDCQTKVSPKTPEAQSSPSTKPKVIACKPSKQPLPRELKGLSKINQRDLTQLKSIERANKVLNKDNLANYLCKAIPVMQGGNIHSTYAPRVYSEMYTLTERLPRAQKELVRSLADHPCFALGSKKLKYCETFKIGCNAIRGGNTKMLQKSLVKSAKSSCLQSFCEGYFMDTGYMNSSKINNLFSDILKGTSYTSMSAYCEATLKRYPSEDGYPLTRDICDGYNGPSRGIVKGEKCSPGAKPEYSSFTRYVNRRIVTVQKKPKKCRKFAPSCFPNFNHDFFYCNLTPHVENLSRCQEAKRKPHPKLKWNKQFSENPSNLTNIAKYSNKLASLEINKLSYTTREKLSEYYLEESVNNCLDGPFSEHSAKLFTAITAMAGGAVVSAGAAVMSIKDNVKEYIKDVRDDIQKRYQPTTFDLSVAVENFHSCMTKSCDIEGQSKCFEILRDHDRKQFMYNKYYSLKCSVSRIGKRMTNVASIVASSKVSALKLSKLAKLGKVTEAIKPDEIGKILDKAGCKDDKLSSAFNEISQSPKAYSIMAKDLGLKAHNVICEKYKATDSQPEEKRVQAASRLLESFCNT